MQAETRMWTIVGVSLALAGAAIPFTRSNTGGHMLSGQDEALAQSTNERTSQIPLSSFSANNYPVQQTTPPAQPTEPDLQVDVEPIAPPDISTEPEEEPDFVYIAPEQSRDPDVFLSLVDEDAAPSDPWSMSDRQAIDAFMDVLNTDQRVAFRSMWATMPPDDRQQFMQELRLAMGG